MKRLYLIGFTGSGKTATIKEVEKLSRKAGLDVDEVIERQYGKSVKEFFKEVGEENFRKVEEQMLKESASSIIATGGGVIETPNCVEWMKSNGKLVYLKVSFEEILKRKKALPLWANNVEELKSRYQKRETLYQQHADLTIDADSKTVEEVARWVITHLE